MYEEYGWTVIQEDNAPEHKKYAIACQLLNGVEILPWPPQLPDLNLIEAL